MGFVSWIGAVAVTFSVFLTAFLVNRFAPKKRRHIRRLVTLGMLYLGSYGIAFTLRYLVHAKLEDAPALCEEKHGRMGMSRQQMQRVVLFSRAAGRVAACGRFRALEADASALLGAKHS